MQPSQRMRPADAAWVGLDRPHNRLVVAGVLRLSGRLDLDELRERVERRLLVEHPRLTVVARRPHRLLPPRWYPDPAFDLRHHVVEAEPDREVDEAGLAAVAGALVSTPLDPARPPWQLHLVRREGGGSALVGRFHHSLADGAALATVLLRLTDDVTSAPGPSVQPPRPRGRRPGALRAVATVVPLVSRLLLTLGEPATALRGPLGPAKRLALTAPRDLDDVRRAAAANGASINDVLLAATAGGIRRHLLELGQAATDLRVVVPVDLRAGAAVPADLGNRFGIVFVRLPVGVPERVRRLHAVRAATSRLTTSSEAGATYLVLQLVGLLPLVVRRLAAGLLGRSASAVVTNVPGPRAPIVIGGCVVEDVAFWVPTVGRIGLGISLFSYAGTVSVGVAVDARLDVDPDRLAAAVWDEVAALADAPAAPADGSTSVTERTARRRAARGR